MESSAWDKLFEILCLGQIVWKAVLGTNCLESGTSIAGEEEHEEPQARDMLQERRLSIGHETVGQIV